MTNKKYFEPQTHARIPEVTNVCAGPFGAFYDFYIERPWLAQAIGRTVARCLKPGAELVGSTFLAAGSWRQRKLLGHGEDTGVNGALCTSAELRGWLADAGMEDVTVSPDRGFAIFRGRRVDFARGRSSEG